MYLRATSRLQTADWSLLCIGIGNSLRGDDGAGPAVVQRLRWKLNSRPIEGVATRIVTQLAPELVCDLVRTRCALFIDADVRPPPARLAVHAIQADPVVPAIPCVGHYETPERLLGLCRRYFGDAPDAYVLALGARAFGYGDPLSPALKALVHNLAEQLFNALIHHPVAQPLRSWNPWSSAVSRRTWVSMISTADNCLLKG
ncbi:MAG: hydrogenase maturation protease [Planctomycetia bacterium]|nr:hydrogenase maturation protease [Planctomycetia bacterium]